ncbi:DUF6463 family protein [Actinomycetospora straminea]|nr:DUF6463 family protein [Actinomycetospora straminea]MDD7934985.1 DUF6463 family protein [Actinomycetospora straminea]
MRNAHDDTAPGADARARAVAGRWLQVLAAGHGVVGLVLHRAAVAEILRRGVVGAVPDHGSRATAFWFLAFTPAVWAAARMLRAVDDEVAARREAALVLAATGVVGAAVMPRSPFWFVIPLGVVAARAHPSRHRASP